jgi:hypothetical protein
MSEKNFQDELFCQKSEKLYLHHYALKNKNMLLILLAIFLFYDFLQKYLGVFLLL